MDPKVLRRVSRILIKRGFAFCKPILYFRVEAHFNRSKIDYIKESTLKSTPSKLNGFWHT
jgi:acetolactate synthase regulatory subunit